MNPSLAERFLHFFGRLLVGLVYKVRSSGAEQLPPGGFLLLPNHLTWVDAIMLQVACPRPIRFIVFSEIYHLPWLHPIFRIVGALPISSKAAKEAVKHASELINKGEIVCIFPEGELSRSGILLRLKRGYELIARAADCPVVPVWLDQLWGSIFSFQGGKYFFKWPKQYPYPVEVAFGKAIPAREAGIGAVRQNLLDLGNACYEKRPRLQGHLARECVKGLKKGQFEIAVIDGMDGTKMDRGTLLAASIVLSKYVKAQCPGNRVAVVLPTGKGAMIANLAVLLSGKTPVNLNFTAGRPSLEAALRIGGLKDAITATAFEKRVGDFPWPEGIHRLEQVMPGLKKKIVVWRVLCMVLPVFAICALLRIPRKGGNREAVVLFTSGSSGAPKGVVLSHRNIIGNVSQFSAMLDFGREDSVLACLPFFHCFGCTVTLWYPLMDGVRAVTYPNPLEIVKNAELIAEHKVSLFCTTPTFLRGFLRKAKPEQLATLKLLITGAEKLPNELAAAFKDKMGVEVLQGYGLTETSPVTSVNLPEPRAHKPDDAVQPSSRSGSVGKLAPGMSARIREPETGADLSLHETGMLWLRGPNIFEGYLDDPKRTADVIVDGWFKTGDLGRFDEDGFLFIEGRLSRFSKIGGEMVPHETLEAAIGEVMQLPMDERSVAVAGVPDEAKGEALVLLTSKEIDPGELRTKLMEAGLPNLWIPKKVLRVEAIPVLASGKLDLQRCKELAEAG